MTEPRTRHLLTLITSYDASDFADQLATETHDCEDDGLTMVDYQYQTAMSDGEVHYSAVIRWSYVERVTEQP